MPAGANKTSASGARSYLERPRLALVGIRLVFRRRFLERLEFHALVTDAADKREQRQVNLEAPGICDLRHQRDVGQSGRVAVTETAGPGFSRQALFEGSKPVCHPVPVPGQLLLLGDAKLAG